jgi:phage shock protein A
MGLWQRIKRIFRAGTGAALDKIENPELVLQQTIRDMRDRIPELNNSVAQVMATERLLAKNRDNLQTQVTDLDSKIRAAVKMDRDDIATAYRCPTRARGSRFEKRAQGTGQLRAEYEEAHVRSHAAHLRRQAGQTAGTACADNGGL